MIKCSEVRRQSLDKRSIFKLIMGHIAC